MSSSRACLLAKPADRHMEGAMGDGPTCNLFLGWEGLARVGGLGRVGKGWQGFEGVVGLEGLGR
eukprot:358860-Chlamydomonas_euryale.AAC.4